MSRLTSRKKRHVIMRATWPSCADKWKILWCCLAPQRRRWKVFIIRKKENIALLELPERVDDQKMPRVRVVDMRQGATKEKGNFIFSPQLKEAIHQRIENAGTDDFIFKQARLGDVVAMSAMRLCCRVPELQRFA